MSISQTCSHLQGRSFSATLAGMTSAKDTLSRKIASTMGYDPDWFTISGGNSTRARLAYAALFLVTEGRSLTWEELGVGLTDSRGRERGPEGLYTGDLPQIKGATRAVRAVAAAIAADGEDTEPVTVSPEGAGRKGAAASTHDAAPGGTVNIRGLERLLAAVIRANRSQRGGSPRQSILDFSVSGGAMVTQPLPSGKNYAVKYESSSLSEESKRARAATDERHDKAIHAVESHVRNHGLVEHLAPWALRGSGKNGEQMYVDLAWFFGQNTVLCELKAGYSEMDKALGQLERYASAVFYESEVADDSEAQKLLRRARGTVIRKVLILDQPTAKNLDAVARYDLFHDSLGTPWTARTLIITTADLSRLSIEGLI